MGSSAGKTNRRRTPGNLGHDSLPLAGGAERYETIQFATRRFAGGAERYEPREGPSRERSSAGTRGGEPRETPCTPSNPDAPRGGAHPVAGARGAHAIFFQSTSVVIHPSIPTQEQQNTPAVAHSTPPPLAVVFSCTLQYSIGGPVLHRGTAG